MAIIPRPQYLDRIVSRLNKDMMIFLIGQRRVGKSFLLRALRDWLLAHRPDSNIVYISKEFQTFSSIKTSDDLYTYVDSLLKPGCENYLLIDEVQDIESYENALRSLHAEEKCQIIATGSNAYVFSSELSTRLGGRYIEIPIYPLSYLEFLEFHSLADSVESLLKYLRVGGMPGLCHFDINDEGEVRDYLQGVYNTVMLRDVVSRENIRNIAFIENLSSFLADNIGKIISVTNISRYMTSQGEPVTQTLTSNYINYIQRALLVNRVSRYDIHGKKLFDQNFKYYFTDQGMRNLLCSFNIRGSIEKVIENVIYSHLLMKGYEVRVGVLRLAEIDFVAKKGDKVVYIQATYMLGSEETVKREFGNLAAIKDNYPKLVVSMDPVGGDFPQYPGIRHIGLREFLNGEAEW